jgi:hypothetical protein
MTGFGGCVAKCGHLSVGPNHVKGRQIGYARIFEILSSSAREVFNRSLNDLPFSTQDIFSILLE